MTAEETTSPLQKFLDGPHKLKGSKRIPPGTRAEIVKGADGTWMILNVQMEFGGGGRIDLHQ